MSCRERVNIPSQGGDVLAVEMEPAAAGDDTAEKVSTFFTPLHMGRKFINVQRLVFWLIFSATFFPPPLRH